MATLNSLVARIISELTAIQHKTQDAIEKDDPFPLPRMIGTGIGNAGILVSRKVDELISVVARDLKSNDPNLVRRVQDNEWNKLVRAAFGPPLSMIDLDADLQANAKIVLDGVKAAIAQSASSYVKREHAFSCTLFSNNVKIDAFTIGSVRFEPRLEWLKRKFNEGGIPKTTYERIQKTWGGKKLTKRKNSFESLQENDILDAVGRTPCVCSVTTDGFAGDAGAEAALTAARLALTSISLLWREPSKVLDGFNLSYDRSVYRKKTLSFIPGQRLLSGSKLSHLPHGPYLKGGVWEKMFAEQADHFKVTAEILDYFLSASGKVARPKLMNTLGQALLWFQKAAVIRSA